MKLAQTRNHPPRHARGLSNQVNNGYTKPLTFPRIQNHALIWSCSNSSVVVNYLLLNTISFLLTQMIHMPANQRTCQRFTTSLLPKTRPWNCWKWVLQSECNAPATPTQPKTFCQICENTEHSKKRCAALSGTSWHAAHKIPSPSCSPLFCQFSFVGNLFNADLQPSAATLCGTSLLHRVVKKWSSPLCVVAVISL